MSAGKQKLIAVAVLVAVILALFSYSVYLRRLWFGVYSGQNHDWLTASTVMFTDNWFREGIWNLRFGMYEEPKSPELSTQISRDPYISYPPGSVLPVFAISLVSGHEPTAGLVMGYDLLNQLLVTLVLSLTVFFFLSGLKVKPPLAAAFALVPAVLELLLPSPFYFFQNSFFSDQAVILPFALAVFLEVLHGEAAGRRQRVIGIIQGLVFFYGTFTDWLFVFVFAAFYIKRLLAREIHLRPGRRFLRESFGFAAGFLAGIAMFFIQLILMMWSNLGWAYQYLDHKYFVRSGIGSSDGFKGFMDYFRAIRRHVWKGYGRTGEILVLLSILLMLVIGFYVAWAAIKKRKSKEVAKIAQLTFILIAPCILQMYIFLDHSAVHSFSALKLSLPIAVVPFVCFPLFLAILVRDRVPRLPLSRTLPFLAAAAVLLAVAYALAERGSYQLFFAPRNNAWYHDATVTLRHDAPDDVVFSPDFEIPYHPPQPVALSMKRVYQVGSAEQIRSKLASARGDYRVEIVFMHKPQPGTYWYPAIAAADSSLEDGDGTCYLFFSPDSIRRLGL